MSTDGLDAFDDATRRLVQKLQYKRERCKRGLFRRADKVPTDPDKARAAYLAAEAERIENGWTYVRSRRWRREFGITENQFKYAQRRARHGKPPTL